MINQIKFLDKQVKEILLFKEIKELPQPICCLFGCNGSGKTTLIKAIQDTVNIINNTSKERDLFGNLRKPKDPKLEFTTNGNELVLYSYINCEDNYSTRETSHRFDEEDMFIMANKFNYRVLSEGQSNYFSLVPLFDALLDLDEFPIVSNTTNLILLDEIDSGLSDNYLLKIITKLKKIISIRNDVQFIISFNSYIFAKEFDTIFNMYNGKIIKIRNYDEYLNLLDKNHERLIKRRNKYYKKNEIRLISELE